jgi:hypothetical protein
MKDTEAGRDHDKEVASHNCLGMIAYEGQSAPAGIGYSSGTLHQILADRARRNPNTQRQFQLVGDAFLSPALDLSRHLADQRWEVFRQTGPSQSSGFPPPNKRNPL